jgi:hypothetical protein
MTEALKTEALHFVRCIEDRVPVTTDGEAGLRVVRILEAASQSLLEQGRLVELQPSAAVGSLAAPIPADGNGHRYHA